MKATTLGLLAFLGMGVTGTGMYTVTPDGGFGRAQRDPIAGASDSADRNDEDERPIGGSQASLTRFTAGSTVKVEGRVGHEKLLATGPEDTFVMLEMKGDDRAGGAAPNVTLSLVIDKSGSMRGTRIQNALSAAVTAVDRLRDGDSLSVVAFDTRVETVVPITTIQAGNRASILRSIRDIQLGGDTCVSCGVEEGLAELRRSPNASQGGVMRMMLLSDGDANNGVRDVAGFRSIAQRAMSSGVNITTIGVDLEFNEKILAALALGSNGRHYFVENDRDLARVFEAEAATLTDSVASNAVAEIDLAQGVELVQVFDRTFSRSASRVSVPLGSLSKGELKTVLLKVRVPKGAPGDVEIATVRVAYRDLAANQDKNADGKLGLALVGERKEVSLIDGLVLDRLQRSETASALRDANSLFSLGKVDEARRRLSEQQKNVATARSDAKASAPKGRAKDVDDSFQRQESELNRATSGFASPPPPAPGAAPQPSPVRAQESNVKRNVESSSAFGF